MRLLKEIFARLKKRLKGFTLLEILMAIAIFALVMGLAYGSYNATFHIINGAGSQAEIYSKARTTMERLQEDLESFLPGEDMIFTGESESAGEYRADTLRFTYESPSTPVQTFDFNLLTRKRELRKTQQVPSGHDPDLYAVERLFVTANDFVYGIKRACNPNTGSYYSGIIAGVIAGCSEVYNAEDPENIPQDLIDAIGVSAPDDETLVIEQPSPAAYFMSMTPMWTIAATPQWAIEKHGEEWIEAGNIVTNGRYVLNEWEHGVTRTLLRNPLMPEDMAGEGNIDRIVTNVVPDTSTTYALWLNNEVDTTGIPTGELEAHLAAFADETVQIPDLAVFYIAFRMTKAPFDNVHVRRAFAAAYDRVAHVEVIEQGQGLPMKHLAPPGIFGAPPIDEVGVGYNVEYAQEQMALAGYPDCEGFPQVTLLGYSGEKTLNWIEFAQAQWEENLGCAADLIQIEQQSFADLLVATKADDAEAPHMHTLGWGPDYADENNWVGDVLDCNINVRIHRTCNEIDDKIEEARRESDPEVRKALYAEIEDMFFGEEGEFPFFPIYLRIAYVGEHSWLTRTPALFGGDMWYTWVIDWDAKQAAQQ